MSENASPEPPASAGGQLPVTASDESRSLSDSQVREILRRASAAGESPHVPERGGPTVGDLIQAAREVGLDPDAVRRAAAITPIRPTGTLGAVAGAPLRPSVTAHLSTPPTEWDFLAETADRVTGLHGTVSQGRDGEYVWRENHGLGRTTIRATDRGIHVEADRAGHYLAHWFAGLLTWGFVSSALPMALSPFLATILFIATPFVLARPFWIRSDAKVGRQLEELSMELLRAADELDG